MTTNTIFGIKPLLNGKYLIVHEIPQAQYNEIPVKVIRSLDRSSVAHRTVVAVCSLAGRRQNQRYNYEYSVTLTPRAMLYHQDGHYKISFTTGVIPLF